nr:hypothetical protein [Angustibacter aerolatus]
MDDVQHMKWWGWGVDGVAFSHADKPHLKPFVVHAVDVDLDVEGAPALSLDQARRAGHPGARRAC